MSAYSAMGDEMKFQQRWEFRRKDNDFDDSSTDDSKSGSMGQPVIIERDKLDSSLISLDDDDDVDTSNIRRLDQNHIGNPGSGNRVESAKGKEKRIKRGRKKNFADGEERRDCQDEVNGGKKSNSIAYDPAAMIDVRNFRESLLENLDVTRENLFTWMKEEMDKLVADDDDDNAPKKRRRNRNARGKNKVQSRKRSNCKKNVQLQQQKSIEENVQVQHQDNNGAIVHAQQQQNSFEDKSFKSGSRDQKGIIGVSSKRVTKSIIRSSEASSDQVVARGGGLEIVPLITSSLGKEKEERLALTVVNTNPPRSVLPPNTKSVVLAIRAQNCIDGSSNRSVRKRKKTGNSNNKHYHYQAPDERVGYRLAIGSLTSTGKNKAENSRSSVVEQSFSLNPTNQIASSMYLPKPQDLNNRLGAFSSNYYIQPRFSGNRTSVNLEGQMHDFSTHFGYFSNMMQPEDRSANFYQMGSQNMSCFNNHNYGNQTSSTGSGYPVVPFHQATDTNLGILSQFLLQNTPQENGNNTLSGLRMNGGGGAITLSGGSHGLSENFLTNNNLLSHSNYRAADDGRLTPHQFPSISDDDGYLFRW